MNGVMVQLYPTILSLLAATLLAVNTVSAANPLNVVMIVSDDMGYADTGVTGLKDFATPNIDSIARDGMFCSRAYVTCAVCSPSRAGFLTGCYQQRFGHEHNGGGPPPFGMPLSQKTMGDHFKAAGYATGAIGKWHLGESEAQHPLSRGFDEFVGHLGGGHAYLPNAKPAGPAQKLDEHGGKILDGRNPAVWNEYLTTYFGHRAVDFIDRHATQPFFLYLAFNAPHTPLQARETDLAKVASIPDDRRRKYAAMMLALDESVGEVLAAIKAKGIENNTLVVFFSDNGGPQPGDPSCNGSINLPFRSGKAQYFDGGIHVPMFIKYPGVIPAGSQYDQMISSLDLLPTFMNAIGKKPLDGISLDGKNVLPFLKREIKGTPHEQLFWRTGAGIALIEGDYKMVIPRRELGLPDNAERPDFSKAMLYKIAGDKSEKSDLASTDPVRLQAMIKTWRGWDSNLVTPIWGTWKTKPGKEHKDDN